MDDTAQGTAVLVAIRRIVRAIARAGRALARESGLTVPQVLTLEAIADGDGEATASSIRERVQVSPGTLSGIVQQLVERGLVARTRDAVDRRRVTLTLTEDGRARVSTAPQTLQHRLLARLGAMSDDERERVLAALHGVVELLEAEDLDASPILTEVVDLADG